MAKTVGKSRFGSWTIPVASVLILICILASSWITFDRVGKVMDAKDVVAHTWQVKGGVEKVYGTVVTAESDVRAYILSKNAPSYTRYLASKAITDAEIARVRDLTAIDPRQKSKLDHLQAAIDDRYASMKLASDIRQSHELDETISILNRPATKGKGIRAMDGVRTIINDLGAEEDRLLAERIAVSRGLALQAESSFLFATVVSIVLITAFGLLSSRLVTLREAAADEERALRGDLERENERTRAAETRLEATMVELQRSNGELQNFAFVASHDLQEPLRKIRAFSDRIRRRSGAAMDAESLDSLLRVEAAADRMQRLILDLLDLSRITTKGRPHVLVDLNSAIEETVDDLQTRLEETGGTIVRENLPSVFVDPAQLRQLLQNLVANALKFRREGVSPVVRIEGEPRPDGRVALRVSDNGIGFEAKHADKIFVVFQRLHGRGEYDGSGIGLAIARKIVERHGGTIAAEGRVGEGASFAFDLPGKASVPPAGVTLAGSEKE